MSDQTIVEKWGGLGFLKDIDDNKLERLSSYYEDAMKYLLSNPNEQTNNVETYIFPILHRLVKETELEFNPISLIHDFRVFINRPDIVDLNHSLFNTDLDMEAHVVGLFIDEVKNR